MLKWFKKKKYINIRICDKCHKEVTSWAIDRNNICKCLNCYKEDKNGAKISQKGP